PYRNMLRWPGVLALVAVFVWTAAAPAQLTPEQQAQMLLDSARKAHNEKNYPFAVTRFREFLSKFGGHKEAPAVKYGLALSLLELPEKDYAGAIEQLQSLAGDKNFSQQPSAIYHLGLAQRGLGLRELAQAVAKPQEANQRRAAANQRFEEAAKQFAAAVIAFTAKAKEPPANAKELPLDLQWAARARCDQAEMLLRLAKPKEAQAAVALFVKDDSPLAKSRYRNLALYYHGFASFLLKDYLAAGKALNRPAVLTDPVFGTHARYLLARVHHLSEEHAEAAAQYEAVLTDYAKNK